MSGDTCPHAQVNDVPHPIFLTAEVTAGRWSVRQAIVTDHNVAPMPQVRLTITSTLLSRIRFTTSR